jgi:uncharacterized protein
MLDNSNIEPPLVTRMEPSVAKRPRPGMIEAVAWCVVFLAVQILAALVVAGVSLAIFAYQTDQPGQFLDNQLKGLSNATAKPTSETERPSMPAEIGQSLAYGMLGAQISSLGLILIVLPMRVGSGWKREVGMRRPAALHILIVLMVVPAFMILADGLQELFVQITGLQRPAATESLNATFRYVPWIVTVTAVALGPGFVEEIWCRGFLGRGLIARYGFVTGILLTSTLFAAMHLDPSQLLIFMLMGAYLHFVYLASRSIWVPILLHMLNNGLAILIIMNSDLYVAAERYKINSEGLRSVTELAALGLLVFASVALWTSRAVVTKKVPVEGTEPADFDYPRIAVPPPESGASVKYAAVSPAAMMLAIGSLAILAYLLSRLSG